MTSHAKLYINDRRAFSAQRMRRHFIRYWLAVLTCDHLMRNRNPTWPSQCRVFERGVHIRNPPRTLVKTQA